jgi:copper(I)-binding protein
MRLILIAALAASLSWIGAASAHSIKAGDLELTDLWTRATPPRAAVGGGYVTIVNHGTAPDRLVAASSPQAAVGEVHEMKVEDGVMTMRPLADGLPIPPGETVTLGPGGYHIMFMELREPFTAGGKVPVTLTFEKAGAVETFLHVEPIGAPGPGGDAHGEEHGQ